MNIEHKNEPDYGVGEKKLKIYIFGIVLCVILTLIPFATVIYSTARSLVMITVIFVCAILQFLAQVIFLLKLNVETPQSKMNVMAFLFTILILLVVIAGSLWIMRSLQYNMMY